MPRVNKHSAEQIIAKLCTVEVQISKDRTLPGGRVSMGADLPRTTPLPGRVVRAGEAGG